MAQTSASPRLRVYLCCAEADEAWLDRLRMHLDTLAMLDVFSHKDVKPGEEAATVIPAQLEAAQAAVLIVSVNFLASEPIQARELPLLLQRRTEGGALIIPVIVKPCLVDGVLAGLKSVGSPTRPLSSLQPHEQEQALVDVARMLSTHHATLREGNAAPTPSPAGYRDQPPRTIELQPRSLPPQGADVKRWLQRGGAMLCLLLLLLSCRRPCELIATRDDSTELYTIRAVPWLCLRCSVKIDGRDTASTSCLFRGEHRLWAQGGVRSLSFFCDGTRYDWVLTRDDGAYVLKKEGCTSVALGCSAAAPPSAAAPRAERRPWLTPLPVLRAAPARPSPPAAAASRASVARRAGP